jgi:hypothetical protein
MSRITDRLNTSPEFCFDLLNGYVKKDVKSGLGIITQRDGSTKLNTVQLGADYGTTKKVRTTFEAKWNGGSTDIIIRAGEAWGKFDGVDTFDSIDTGRSNDVVGQCAMFKNELIMVDGGVPRKMTSAGAVSALSSDGNMPQDSTAVWVHSDKVWLNSAANPMMAYFCKTNSANASTSWTGSTDAGTLDLSTILPEGDTLIGFRTYGATSGNYIALICKKYTVVFAAGANAYDFTLLQYFPTTCLSLNAAAYIGKDLVYPSDNNFTNLTSSQVNQGLDVKSLSLYIEPLYRDLVNSLSDKTQVSGTFNHKLNHYYITFQIPNNFQTLVYSVDVGNFVGRWTYPYEIYSWCEQLDGTILSGGDGYVYTMNNTANDDGTTVEWKFAMPAVYFGDASRYKKPIQFEALLQNTGTSLDLYLDYWYGLSNLTSDKVTKQISLTNASSFWDVAPWDTSYWDSSGNNLFKTSDLLGIGRMMVIELRHSTKDSQITIPWFLIRFSVEGNN